MLHCTIHRSLASKEASGAGVGPYQWTYAYSTNKGTYHDGQLDAYLPGDPTLPEPAEGGYPAPIETGEPENYRSVTIDGPNRRLVYYIDREFDSPSENTIVVTDVLNAAGSVLLQRTETTWAPVGSSLGSHWYQDNQGTYPVNAVQLTHRMRATQTVVQQYHNPANYDSFDSYTTSTAAGEFDAWGYATAIHESNNFSTATRTTQNTWQHSIQNAGTANEVRLIGLPRTVTVNGTQMVEHHYDPTSMLRDWSETFGTRHQSWTYHGSETSIASGQRGTIETSTDANNHTTTYSDWKRGTPETVVYPDDTPTNTADNPSRQFFVDDFGQVQSATDEDGDTTSYDYDELGRLAEVRYPADSGNDWLPKSISWSFYSDGNPVSGFPYIGCSDQDANLPFLGDHWRRLVLNGELAKITYFDALMQPVLKTSFGVPDPQVYLSGSIAIPQPIDPVSVRVGYDSEGRVTFTSYPERGCLDWTDSELNDGTWVDYDALGRVIATQADSNLGPLTTSKLYLADNKIEVKNPRNFKTTTTFQAFGSPAYQVATKLVFADGTETSILRDVFGKPETMTQSAMWTPPGETQPEAISVSHKFKYDTHQRLCLQTSPEIGQTAYDYYGNGLVKWRAEGLSGHTGCVAEASIPSGSKITRSYDARDRLTNINYPTDTPDKSFSYWPDGRVKTARRGSFLSANAGTATAGSGSSSTWTLSWNHRGLLIGEFLDVEEANSIHEFDIHYQYDDAGSRKSIRYPSGRHLGLAPDARGRPSHLMDEGGGKIVSFAPDIRYSEYGKPRFLQFGNGVFFKQTETLRGYPRTVQYYLQRAGTPGVEYFTYRVLQYDPNGNLDWVLEDGIFGPGDLQLAIPTYGTDSRYFTYDSLDRLIEMDSGWLGLEQYNYDPLGNILSRRVTGGPLPILETYEYDVNHNRVAQVNGGPFYQYDTRGDVTAVGGVSVEVNRAGETVRHEKAEDAYASDYRYDARGWRIREHTVYGTTQTTSYFVYDKDGRLMERVQDGVVTDFVYLGEKPIARVENGMVSYIHSDYHNSPLFESDQAGDITRKPVFYAYGQPNVVDTASLQLVPNGWSVPGLEESPGYAGSYPDANLGLLYMGARFSHNVRFMSPDPAPLNPLHPAGLNRYAYANNNPVRFVDRDGRNATAALGGLIVESINFVQGEGFNGGQVLGALKDGYNGQGAGIASAAWQDVGTVSAALGVAGAIKGVSALAGRFVAKKAIQGAAEAVAEISKAALSKGNKFFKGFATRNPFDQTTSQIGKFTKFAVSVPGRAKGSFTRWVKIVNPSGKTTRLYHDTFDKTGKFIHRGVKVPGPERHVP